MSHRRRRLLTILTSSLILPLGSLSITLADVVTLTSDATTKGAAGGLVRGQVTAESPTKVEVKLGNTVTSIPTNEVVSINYDGHPASLEQAQAKESANALAEAADLYKKAATESANKPFVAQDATFGQARVLAEIALNDASRAPEAISVLEGFARTYKTGRHIGPALESLAKLQIARENYPGVEQTLTQLATLPKGDERAAILRIKIQIKKGQLDQAIADLDKVIAGSADGSTKKRDAQLAKPTPRPPSGPSSRNRPPRTPPPRPPRTTRWATASTPPAGTARRSTPSSTPTCSSARRRTSTPAPSPRSPGSGAS